MEQVTRRASQAEIGDILETVMRTPLGATESHDLPGGLIPTEGERALPAERIESAKAETITLPHKLEDLAKEFYLFTFAPVYAVTGFPHEVVYQFGSSLKLDRVPKVLQYQSPLPLFHGEGNWVFQLQGLPKDKGHLFNLFALNMVISDSAQIPKTYWRVNSKEVELYTPGELSAGVPVRVYVPTGIDYQIGVYTPIAAPVQFCRLDPEDWVVAEARRYFIAM